MDSWLEIAAVRDLHPETPEDFGLPLAQHDIETALGFGSAARRAQWLTWRGVVRRRLGEETVIEYACNGAPQLRDLPCRISVTHSRDYVAVICSPRPCAIDIERLDRKFGRIAARYLTPQEEALGGEHRDMFRALGWCAKETLYKYDGHPETDMLHDLRITGFHPDDGVLEARIRGGETLRLRFFTFDGHALTYLCDRTPEIILPR